MIRPPTIRPTVILPDTAPLIHLAAAEALHVLNGMGRVIVVDVVVLEATYDLRKPYAHQIAEWLEAGRQTGSNQRVEVAETELGSLYRLALEQGMRPPRNAGEIAITDWLAEELPRIGGPALVVYENGRVSNLLAREGVAETVAVATTRNLIELAEQEGIVSDAATLWAKIQAAAPTVNPASYSPLSRPPNDDSCPRASGHPPLRERRNFSDAGCVSAR